MYIRQLYTKCLAQAAYYIESDREAIVIDPLRDVEQYLELAKSRGATIRYIFETHFHADFVSGHRDLAKATGATIVFGPGAKPGYPVHAAVDGERFIFGHLTLGVMHTPGHTVESSCYLLYDETRRPYAVFTGDTLFAGDVGRPDLMSGNLDAKTLAGKLYDSLQDKIKKLPHDVIVYPGHGPGSACGKNIGKETMTSIGMQLRHNYALKNMPKEKFISLVTEGLAEPPQYFFSDAKLNINGSDDFETVLQNGMRKMVPAEFDRVKHEGSVVLDSRPAQTFALSHIPGSVNIGLDGDFAVWAGTLFPYGTEFILVTENGMEKETVTRLARIGYDRVNGLLDGSMEAWIESGRPAESIPTVTPDEFEVMSSLPHFITLDVRRSSEIAYRKLRNSVSIPLSELPRRVNALDPQASYLVYCAGGYRSMIAASLMRAAGIEKVFNVAGGITKVAEEKPELVEEAVVG